MKCAIRAAQVMHAGDKLRGLAKTTSFFGFYFSLLGTCGVWAGTDSFNCTPIVWKVFLAINLISFLLTWIVYLFYKNTNSLVGAGLLMLCGFFNLFWLFGFSNFYFYFLFSPIKIWWHIGVPSVFTIVLLCHAYLIFCDIKEAFLKSKKLFGRMYVDEGSSIVFDSKAALTLQKIRKNRNPFKPIFGYAAIMLTPFVLVLNRLLTPIFGDGHGVFLVLAFFSVPMLLFGVEIVVHIAMTMIYYPIKLQHETGKPVLLKES